MAAEQITAQYASSFFNASAFFNLSSSILSSPAGLLWAVPRFAQRASSFAFFDLPEHLDLFISKAMGPGSLIAGATSGTTTSNASITPAATASSASSMAEATSLPTNFADMSFATFIQNWGLYKISNIDGIFSYIISRWAVSTVLIAIILNRTQVYASSRRHLSLNFYTRLAVRLVPIVTFIFQIRRLLESLQCQTGPYELQIHVPTTNDVFHGAFTNEGGFLYNLSSTLLFWQDHRTSCLRSNMIPVGDDPLAFTGSSALLWPLFLDLCISHFVEVLSSSLQGRQPMAETGMTIFEHSLAFAEAEAVVRGSVGLGFFNIPRHSFKSGDTATTSTASPKTTPPAGQLTRSMLLSRLNVPPEVLLIGLISCGSHLSSHFLGVFGLQAKFRLINTGLWALCFMTAFLWSFIKFSRYPADDDGGVLRYPTVCIIGFIPHMLIIAGIFICGFIYCLALIITALSPPTEEYARGSFFARFKQASKNLQASASLAQIKISWKEEFYTTLLKVGFTILTSASEAVYFNEGTNVAVTPRTWLEEKRLGQYAKSRAVTKVLTLDVPPVLQGDSGIADGVGLVDEETYMYLDGKPFVSGFARERKTTARDTTASTAATREEGVGGTQRSGRWILSGRFLKSVSSLLKLTLARTLHLVMYRLGIKSPKWLKKAAGCKRKSRSSKAHAVNEYGKDTLDFWYLTEDGALTLPEDANVDVEFETRKRLAMSDSPIDYSEQAIDQNLYQWWKTGGWWGEVDGSGLYEPSSSHIEEDVTSVISQYSERSTPEPSSAPATEQGTPDGDLTPTQENPHPDQSRESSPVSETEAPISLSYLAQMLDPKTLEDKQDARLLALRLRSKSGPMTRAQYRQTRQAEQARILAPSYRPNRNNNSVEHLTAEEEEDLLEQIILSRRMQAHKASNDARNSTSNPSTQHVATGSWATGADGMGADGPQCVVCHSSPRSILVWPCRCLSLCEECRISLAMNNFGSCVCCRREVAAFSRLYVP